MATSDDAETADAPSLACESRLANVTGAVLVGGESSRMGCDKAHLEVAGGALATRTAHLLGELCCEVLLVGGVPPEDAIGRHVQDPPAPGDRRSALRGLVGALEAASSERVLVVATDMPLLSAELLLALMAWPEHDAVVARDAQHVHPLCAVYRRESVLAVARARLGEGKLALRGVIDAVDTAFFEGADLARIDPEGRALLNVNSPDELEGVIET